MTQRLGSILLFIICFISQLKAQTVYECGIETGKKRFDTVLLGSAGGFNGYRDPSPKCDQIYITFTTNNSPSSPNYIPTNEFTGVGSAPFIAPWVKHLHIIGDLSTFDTIVSGNTNVSGDGNVPIYPPVAYGLPTPNSGTTIHFSLDKPPASNPLTWFQRPLPANCTVVVELRSCDPFLDKILPLNGGYVVIGAPTKLPIGFSDAAASSKPIVFQRHPELPLASAYAQAKLIMQEETTFNAAVWGISLNGAFLSHFSRDSSLAIPDEDSAAAGFAVARGKAVILYTKDLEAIPTIKEFSAPGGSNFLVSKKVDEEKLPLTTVAPVRHY
ncbi:MAG: hypothetical protein ACK4V2_03935 [Pseudomonadota bacterium]|jgi:hypothetical protein|nr:hypothetical protein [Alphaproteobacteria bacterium]